MIPSATELPQADVTESVPNQALEGSTESFWRAARSFQRAARTRPDLLRESHYRFGNRPVRMRVVGRTLAQHLADAFAHLRTAALEGQTPQLTIDLWDEIESGIPLPTDSAEEASDLTWRTGEGLLEAYARGRLLYYRQRAGATWFDRRSQHMVGWRASGEELGLSERSKPLPLLLSIWYYDRDLHIIHAGLIARKGEGVLVGGPSGTGKSTTSLVCLLNGFDYLGDDHIGLSAGANGLFTGHSLYNGARLSAQLLGELAPLKSWAIPSNSPKDNKFLVLLSQILPSQIKTAATIRAIVMPNISHLENSRLRRATKREVMLRLAPTSFFTPFSSGASGFERLGQLVDRVPLYWLEMTERLDEIPPLMHQILDEASPL